MRNTVLIALILVLVMCCYFVCRLSMVAYRVEDSVVAVSSDVRKVTSTVAAVSRDVSAIREDIAKLKERAKAKESVAYEEAWHAIEEALAHGTAAKGDFSALAAIAARGMRTHLRSEQNPGRFHRKRFENVVEQIRAMGLKPGEEKHLHLDDISVPRSLRKLNPGEPFGARTGDVWAHMSRRRELKVVILTRAMGHAGDYGFAYSDVPLSPVPSGKGWFKLDVPGDLYLVTPEMQIDDKWWKVLNNLG